MIIEASIHEAFKLTGASNPPLSMVLILSPKEEQQSSELAGITNKIRNMIQKSEVVLAEKVQAIVQNQQQIQATQASTMTEITQKLEDKKTEIMNHIDTQVKDTIKAQVD